MLMQCKERAVAGRAVMLAFVCLSLCASCGGNAPVLKEVPVYSYEVIACYPHDPAAFTEGLVNDHGTLFESTGQYGMSSLREIDLQTGRVIRARDLPGEFFGEGLALANSHLVQLTWQSHTGFVYDPVSFQQQRAFSYTGEGWGLTFDGRHLIMSDGTSRLHF